MAACYAGPVEEGEPAVAGLRHMGGAPIRAAEADAVCGMAEIDGCGAPGRPMLRNALPFSGRGHSDDNKGALQHGGLPRSPEAATDGPRPDERVNVRRRPQYYQGFSFAQRCLKVLISLFAVSTEIRAIFVLIGISPM